MFINDAQAVTALQFYVDLVLKHKVAPPQAMTWEFDEIIAGGQKDRYAMTQTFALRHADQRSATVEDRRPLGLVDCARLHQ